MANPPRLQTELLDWFFNVVIVMTTAFLVNAFPVLQFMSPRLPTHYDISFINGLYFAAWGGTTIVVAVTLFLALLWHIPKILAADIERKQHWLDAKSANVVFVVGAIAAAVLIALAVQQRLDCEESVYWYDPSAPHKFGLPNCKVNHELQSMAMTIWGILALTALFNGLRLAWLGWNGRSTNQ